VLGDQAMDILLNQLLISISIMTVRISYQETIAMFLL